MNLKRIVRHLLAGSFTVKSAFPPSSLQAITAAICETESMHSGQIRFAVEASLDLHALLRNQNTRERALDVFSQLRIWDTENNNGVLIYLLLADRTVEIIADRGIHVKLGNQVWEAICRQMEVAFGQGRFEAGVIEGIHAVGKHLRHHFPAKVVANELPDQSVVL